MILVVVECKMMNKKNGAVLFSTVYFNAVLAGSFPTNREQFRWLAAKGSVQPRGTSQLSRANPPLRRLKSQSMYILAIISNGRTQND
jgi:hypothetical protein